MFHAKGVPGARGALLTLAVVVASPLAWAGAGVSGRVVSDLGPVGGATVHVYARESEAAAALRRLAGRSREPLATVRSAADGRFRIEGTPPAADLEARAEGFAPGFSTASNGDDVTLPLAAAGTRKGFVTVKGRPVAGATLVWLAADALGLATAGELIATSAPDGSYEVPDPDLWATRLVVTHSDYALLVDGSGGFDHERGGWPSPLAHELQAGGPIHGKVVEERTGTGVPRATLSLDGWPLARTDARGAFLIRHAAYDWENLVATTDTLAGTARRTQGRVVVRMRPAHTLAGVVRDSQTRHPIAGATLALHGEASGRSLAATSDSSGRYAFDSLPGGRYVLYVSRAGYAPSFPRRESDLIDLRQAPARHEDVTLIRFRRLSGRVQDEQGRPVPDAFVGWGDAGAPNLYVTRTVRDLVALGEAASRTAADGSFELAATHDTGAKARKGHDEPPLIVLKSGYAAGRVDPVALRSGRPVVVALSRGVELKGRVTDSHGVPLSGVSVSVAEAALFAAVLGGDHPGFRSSPGEGWATSDAAGRFMARVHPRAHRVAFRKGRYVPRVVSSHDPSGGQNLDVVLDAAAALRGEVVRDDGTGVAGVSIYAQMGSGRTAGSATTEADGRFVVEDLQPGRYELVAYKEDAGLYLKRDVEAPAPDVRFELGPTGTIRGRVVDAESGQPVPHFQVALQPEARGDGTESPSERQREISDASGEFVFDGVPLGSLSLAVRADGYVPTSLAGLVLDGGAADALEVQLDSGATIRGRVTSPEGEGISGATVAISGRDEGRQATAQADESGDYELSGVATESVTLEFRSEGYVTARRVVNAGETARVDATLARGHSLQGTVVSDGESVPDASVMASSSAVDAEPRSTSTDERGRFTLEGLAPGRYSIRATSAEAGEAELADVDAEAAGPLRIVLERKPTAVLAGTVTGLSAEDEVAMAMVSVEADDGGRAHTRVDASGAFRLDDAPAGRVKARGQVTSLAGGTRSSRTVDLVLAAGTETQTLIEFRNDVVVTGSVTRDGAPVPHAFVSFRANDGDAGVSSARTDSAGQYEVGGLEPGRYQVDVTASGVSFETESVVTASGQFDIDISLATLRGTTVEAADGTALAGVDVSFWRLEAGRENRPAESATTTASGEFAVTSLREGRYRLLTFKAGYGQATREIELARGADAEVVLELVPAEGISLKVLDARSERPLDATVVVRDLSRRIVANRHTGGADGTLQVALAAGQYLLSTSADGFGTATIPVTAPARDVRVGLTPGGTLVVESERALHGEMRLLRPDGEEYVRCWCNGIAGIDLKGRRTTVPNVTPETYAVDLVEKDGTASSRGSVEIREGETSTLVIE